ncbi:hypothetical protein O6P43_013860 [Quillaja saponaria]|uniref:Uncharacterized protein n=1 Tax=Quillaja saponaria TaxID=32244 RepID=A0AAD7LTI5_QUISA|nr:hypothetical protein O6P43_013860 [Quillaja saponaria]
MLRKKLGHARIVSVQEVKAAAAGGDANKGQKTGDANKGEKTDIKISDPQRYCNWPYPYYYCPQPNPVCYGKVVCDPNPSCSIM